MATLTTIAQRMNHARQLIKAGDRDPQILRRLTGLNAQQVQTLLDATETIRVIGRYDDCRIARSANRDGRAPMPNHAAMLQGGVGDTAARLGFSARHSGCE